MCNDMQVALGQFMALWSPLGNHIWFGYFSPLKVILGPKITNNAGDTDDDGTLWHVFSSSDVWMFANVSTIRVVARSGKKWFLDPPFQECLRCCSLWVFQKSHFIIWIGIQLIINGKNRMLVEMVNTSSFFSIQLS